MASSTSTTKENRNRLELDERLARTESDVVHLSETLDSFSRTVVRRFDELGTKIDNISERNAITWPLVFSAIGTLLGCASIGGIIHTMSLNPLISAIQQNAKQWDRFYDGEGHPTMVKETAVLQNEVQGIKSNTEKLEDLLEKERLHLVEEIKELESKVEALQLNNTGM